MRKRLITIATLVAVLALIVTVPVFASGCGDDDEFAYADRMGQQYQDRDNDGDADNYGGRGMMGRQGQDGDRDGFCDQDEDCLGYGDGDSRCDGDCDGFTYQDCPGAANGDCDGDCVGTQVFDEPICF